MGMRRTTVAGLLLAPAMAHALTFAVTGTADEEDLTPGNAICASATGACTLRAALQEANELVGVDVITIPAGTYVLTLDGDGENDGLTGDLDVRDAVEIQGAGRDSVVIDGAGNDRVFHVHPEVGLTISGVTIRNGVAPDAGGGIRHEGEAPLVVRDARFDANTASEGAAIYHGNDALVVSGTIFSGNVATNVGGGIAKFDGTQELSACEFVDNVGLSAGGGIYHGGTGNIQVTGSTFRDHYGNAGGCVYVNTDGGVLTLSGSQFERCFASAGGPGGGVYFTSTTGGLTLAGSTFSGGVAVVGAGVYVATGAGITVTGSTFTDNLASSGAVVSIATARARRRSRTSTSKPTAAGRARAAAPRCSRPATSPSPAPSSSPIRPTAAPGSRRSATPASPSSTRGSPTSWAPGGRAAPGSSRLRSPASCWPIRRSPGTPRSTRSAAAPTSRRRRASSASNARPSRTTRPRGRAATAAGSPPAP